MPTDAAGPLSQLPIIPYMIIFLIFYVLVIKPQKKKQKDHKELLTKLKKNDQIVTAGGMHGVVSMVKEKTVMIRIDDNVKVEFDIESVSTVANKSTEKKK